MEKYRQKIGLLGEKLASKFLLDKGYKIIDKNISRRCGEIDILAKFREKYIFFEIKTRTSLKFGYPEEAINSKKIAKISQTINKILEVCPNIKSWQFDCLSVLLDFNKKKAEIYHLKNLDLAES